MKMMIESDYNVPKLKETDKKIPFHENKSCCLMMIMMMMKKKNREVSRKCLTRDPVLFAHLW